MFCCRYGVADMVWGRYGFPAWPTWFSVDIVLLWPTSLWLICFVADMVVPLHNCTASNPSTVKTMKSHTVYHNNCYGFIKVKGLFKDI